MAPTKTSLALLFVDKKTVVIGVLVLAASFALGVIIGYFGKSDGNEVIERYVTDQFKTNQDMVLKVIKDVDTTKLREYHKFLTEAPHIAGLQRDQQLTGWIQKEWTDEGLDRVELAEYDFYLSWPNASNPNLIRLLDENGKPCISN